MNQDNSNTVEYRDAGCVFTYSQDKEILRVQGGPKEARRVILKLRREGWLSQNLKAIWFSGDPAILLAGINLTLYLAAAPLKQRKRNDRSFKDIVSTPTAS